MTPRQPLPACAACKQEREEMFFDKRYKHSICRSCFIERRNQASKALDSDWFLANIPFDQFTADEKFMTGIGSQEEYKLALQKPEE